MKEEWKAVPNTDLEVSSLGRVRRYLQPETHSHGYQIIRFGTREAYNRHYVHRLITAAFLGPCPMGLEVNHKDSDKTNNAIDNLEYVTHRENIQQVIDEGRGCMGLSGEENYRNRGKDASSRT